MAPSLPSAVHPILYLILPVCAPGEHDCTDHGNQQQDRSDLKGQQVLLEKRFANYYRAAKGGENLGGYSELRRAGL